MQFFIKGLLYFIFFIIGVVVFSFANIVIYRLPEKRVFAKDKLKCMKCGHELSVKDMIPIISWISLKGKCRYCGEKISVRDMIVELFGGISAVGLTVYYGINLKALTIFLFFAVLTIITCIDMDTMEIPFVLNVIILILGVISIFTVGGATILERIIGMFCISLPLFLIVLVIPEGFGGGDIKLMFAAGLFLGWKATVIAFLIGLVLGGGYGVICLLKRKRGKKDHFAFGPFLSVGLAIAVFCGTQLMDMYLHFLKMAFYV
ncbi:MAG: prepilin peptidase, partial [Coprococcus sp.]